MTEEETIKDLRLLVDTVMSEEDVEYLEEKLMWLEQRVVKLKAQNKEMREGLEAYGR